MSKQNRQAWWKFQEKVKIILDNDENSKCLLSLLPAETKLQWEEGLISLVDILPIIADKAFED